MALLVELQPGAMRQRVAALHLGEVAHVVSRQGRGVGDRLLVNLVGHAGRGRRAQQPDIDVVQLGGVDGRPRLVAHLGLLLAEEVGELLDLGLHRVVDLGIGIGQQHRHLEVAQLLLLRARQGRASSRGRRSRRARPSTSMAISRSSAPRASGPTTRDVGRGPRCRPAHGPWGRRCPRSACGRTRRNSARGCGSTRRCRCRPRCRSGRRPAPRPSRPTSRRACARGPTDCWSCRRPRCSSASRRGSAARWSCRTA